MNFESIIKYVDILIFQYVIHPDRGILPALFGYLVSYFVLRNETFSCLKGHKETN